MSSNLQCQTFPGIFINQGENPEGSSLISPVGYKIIRPDMISKRYNESFNGKLRDELLNGEIFNNLKEAEILIEKWRKECNGFRPHSALNYQPPAPSAVLPKVQRSHHLRLT